MSRCRQIASPRGVPLCASSVGLREVRFARSGFSKADRVAGGIVPRVWTIAISATLRSGDIVGFCVGVDETLRRIDALYSEV